MSIINTNNAEHYIWGNGCDGWHLLKQDDLSVIQECVPMGEKEVRHYHQKSQQFFYVLSGIATLELSGTLHEVPAGSSIHVPAGEPHQLANRGEEPLHFLVISQPKSHGDRILQTD